MCGESTCAWHYKCTKVGYKSFYDLHIFKELGLKMMVEIKKKRSKKFFDHLLKELLYIAHWRVPLRLCVLFHNEAELIKNLYFTEKLTNIKTLLNGTFILVIWKNIVICWNWNETQKEKWIMCHVLFICPSKMGRIMVWHLYPSVCPSVWSVSFFLSD